jgi:hypothetical protein
MSQISLTTRIPLQTNKDRLTEQAGDLERAAAVAHQQILIWYDYYFDPLIFPCTRDVQHRCLHVGP